LGQLNGLRGERETFFMPEINDQYNEKIVAFLDIFGFRTLVHQSRSDAIKLIKEIDASISRVVDAVKNETEGAVSVKLFSDCFCLSCDDSDLDQMVRELCFLQLFLATDGIFVKGGLSKGNHFENDRIIFSEGLVKAYELQEHERFPRVLVEDCIATAMKTESHRHYGDALADYLAVAPDGKYFLDYLQSLREGELSGEWDDLIESHKQAIVKQVRDNVDNYKVVEKYRWLAEYHNDKFSQFYNLSDYYEDYQPELLSKMFISPDIFPPFRIGSLGFSKIQPQDEE